MMPNSANSARAINAAKAALSETPSRKLFKNKAYDEIRSRLISNHYPAGTYLSERQLAAELGMSKTPVKAALERLEMEGYICVSPQMGITVREMSDVEIDGLYDIRMALEGYVLRQLAGRLNDQQLTQWHIVLQTYERHANSVSDRLKAVELDAEFHLLPCMFYGNREIVQTMTRLWDKVQLLIHSAFTAIPNRAEKSVDEHRQILEAVRTGNGQLAVEHMETHLRVGQQVMRSGRAAQRELSVPS